jgi:hypothetical protein
MARADVQSSVQQAGTSVIDSAHGLAASAADTVREQAAAVGETVSNAVSTAVEVAAKRGKRAQKKARKQAARVLPTKKESSKGKKVLGWAALVAALAGAAALVKKKTAQPDDAVTAVR